MTKETSVEKVPFLVTMEDGSEVDFATSNPDKPRKSIIDIDHATGDVVFKVFNGFIKKWSIPFLEALTPVEGTVSAEAEFIRTVYIEGILSKVRNSLSALKTGEELSAEIEKQTSALSQGKFSVRAPSTRAVTLNDMFIRAWAYAVSLKEPGKFGHWGAVSTNDVPNEVALEVLTAWKAYDPARKRELRNNDYIAVNVRAKLEAMLGIDVVAGADADII